MPAADAMAVCVACDLTLPSLSPGLQARVSLPPHLAGVRPMCFPRGTMVSRELLLDADARVVRVACDLTLAIFLPRAAGEGVVALAPGRGAADVLPLGNDGES